MKIGLLISISILFAACSDSFINHSMQVEKAGDCNNEKESIKMISNINGERYEFYECLSEKFDGKNYTIERKGDSLVLLYPKQDGPKLRYKIILDIDAKPAYHHIVLGDQTLVIVPSEK